MLNPGATIGIIGGGQLGRMLAMAAAKLGFQIVILDPAENPPAAQVANDHIVAAYDDRTALKQINMLCDVITYEFENVPVHALETISADIPIFPNINALAVSQDRLAEKSFFNDLGIETAPFFVCETEATLLSALKDVGGKGIVKTRRFGYDGKGQVRVSVEDADSVRSAVEIISQAPSILEGFVLFEKEISVIAARDQNGKVRTFDPAENVHETGILRTSTVPANCKAKTAERAYSNASKVLEALDYVGVIGIEFFLMENGDLVANEFAPRVHNSGHWTEAACTVSQFEQHIRAITGLPLGNTHRHSDCQMENLIGADMERFSEILNHPNVMLHLYGKAEVREGRKMGHFTRVAPLTF